MWILDVDSNVDLFSYSFLTTFNDGLIIRVSTVKYRIKLFFFFSMKVPQLKKGVSSVSVVVAHTSEYCLSFSSQKHKWIPGNTV